MRRFNDYNNNETYDHEGKYYLRNDRGQWSTYEFIDPESKLGKLLDYEYTQEYGEEEEDLE